MSLFKNFWVLLLTFLVGVLFIASPAFAQTAPFSDDFESYPAGPIAGQGGWQGYDFNVTGPSSYYYGTTCFNGSQCLVGVGNAGVMRSGGAPLPSGSWDIHFKVPVWPQYSAGSIQLGATSDGVAHTPVSAAIYPGSLPDTFSLSTWLTDSSSVTPLIDNIPVGDWHTLTLSWAVASDSCHFFASVDQAPPVEWRFAVSPPPNLCNASQSLQALQHLGGVNTLLLTAAQPPNTWTPWVWWYIDDIGLSASGAPSLGNLAQYQEDGTTSITWGAGFIGNSVVLKADVADTGTSNVTLQVEVKPVNDMFDGTNLYSTTTNSGAASSLATTTLAVTISNLFAPTSTVPIDGITNYYHWRARVIDDKNASSTWATFSSLGIGTDFSAHYALGQAAADQAIQMIHQNYLWGGKGWDVYDKQFVDKNKVVTQYNYWSSTGKVAQGNGLDCSGLVAWSYDHAHDPATFFRRNFIGEPNADKQYYYNMQSTSTSDGGLQPGDVAFFGTGATGTMSHVAMYVGNHGDYDVVEARSPFLGIGTSTTKEIKNRLHFVAFGHPKDFGSSRVSASTASPVKLSVTDPTGVTLNTDTVIPSDEEYIREAGDMTYLTYGIDALGYPEDMIYSPTLKPGVYHVSVTPLPDTTPNQTYSLTFTAGSTTIPLAVNAPLSTIPSTGYGIVVASNGTAMLDATPPEAAIGFSTSTKRLLVTGTDDVSTTTIVSTLTSAVISDVAGNTLTLKTAQNVNQANHTALTIPSFVYSTGTTTNATTTLRVFWTTDKSGAYPLFIEAIKTPTNRIIAIYTSLLNKTYVVTSTSTDDTADLSLQSALLLLRQKLKTYSGLVIPTISTNKGAVLINY